MDRVLYIDGLLLRILSDWGRWGERKGHMADAKGKIYGRDIVGKHRKRTAVALEYEPVADRAPKVVASGRGYVAERIIDTAEENAVPVHQDENLAKSLEDIEIGEYIPPELYQVVAEVLIFVDAMDKIKGKWNTDFKR